MLTVQGIYDGENIKPLETIPFKTKKKVMITFLEESAEEVSTDEIDAISALRGCAEESGLNRKLLLSRKRDLEMEEEKWRK